jgi:hypothetical protein
MYMNSGQLMTAEDVDLGKGPLPLLHVLPCEGGESGSSDVGVWMQRQ